MIKTFWNNNKQKIKKVGTVLLTIGAASATTAGILMIRKDEENKKQKSRENLAYSAGIFDGAGIGIERTKIDPETKDILAVKAVIDMDDKGLYESDISMIYTKEEECIDGTRVRQWADIMKDQDVFKKDPGVNNSVYKGENGTTVIRYK